LHQQNPDNNGQITTSHQDIGIDLSQYELNNPTDQPIPPDTIGENNVLN